MKKILLLMLVLNMICLSVTAQNVGIGTTEPNNKLQVQGSIVVTTPATATNTAPTAAQTKTMINASTISFTDQDSTGRIYDPGGPGANYLPNMIADASIAYSPSIGIEVTVETMDLKAGDSLIIKESYYGRELMAVGNFYHYSGKWVFNSNELYIHFKSNGDANTGAGFSLLFRRLYDNGTSLPEINGYAGKTFFFDAKKGALRSGYLANSVVGEHSFACGDDVIASGNNSTAMGDATTASGFSSTAMGYITTASGSSSTAMGRLTIASGYSSTAMGDYTTASGNYSTAMGRATFASGSSSTAMGDYTTASGNYSTAMGLLTNASGSISFATGRHTTASGDFSTAMGNYVSTNNQEGSFVIGDNSTTSVMLSANANNFRARFAGGYKLFTSANLSTGCTLYAGDNAWTTGSDVRSKENFAEVNGEDFLKKIAGFHLTSWNYKTQDPKTFRHYGPMAQDFFAAFGKDEYGTIGNDTTINSADFAGVSFIAIQALEKRTQKIDELINENEKLKVEIEMLKKNNASSSEVLLQMRKEIDALKINSPKH